MPPLSADDHTLRQQCISWQTEVAGHDVRVFVELEPYLAALLDDLRSAKQRIWIETYILGDDAVGRTVGHLLAERAAEGLDVRLMIDAIGSIDADPNTLAEIETAGGKVHVFHSFGFTLWQKMRLSLLNRRNHRKLVLVDDRVAYFGGMNLADPAGGEPSAGWRDVQVRLVGPQVDEIRDAMDRLWRRAHHKRVRWPKWPIRQLSATGGEAILMFDSLPSLRFRKASRVFRTLIRRARKCITLSMAYFIPQGGVLRELFKARRREVKIRVIVPAEGDVPVVQWATEHFYARLLKRGIRIYERRDQMLHGKLMVVDNGWSVVGSCNLDPRSLQWNLEFLVAIRSVKLATIMNEVVIQELRGSHRVTSERVARRTLWQRLRGQISWWFRQWL